MSKKEHQKRAGRHPFVCWSCMVDKGADVALLILADRACLSTGTFFPMVNINGTYKFRTEFGWGRA